MYIIYCDFLVVIYGAVAYEFAEKGSKFSFMPELRLGTGIADGKMAGVKLAVNSFRHCLFVVSTIMITAFMLTLCLHMQS